MSELASGSTIAFPVANPSLVSIGVDEDDVILEQTLFLSAHLESLSAEEVARFSFPDGASAQPIVVPLTRDDLPRKVRFDVDLELPCVAIPHQGATWVVVVPLQHTVWVPEDEDLAEAVREDVRRYVSALSLEPDGFLDLFPPVTHRVEEVELSVSRRDAVSGSTSGLRKRVADAQRKKQARTVLLSIGNALHRDQSILDGAPIVKRDAELKTLTGLLSPALQSGSRQSVALVGDELVGKSALFEQYVRDMVRSGEPNLIIGTSAARLVAGMSMLGQWQERLKRVMEAAELLNAVLYFDDLAGLVSSKGEGGVDLARAITTYLDDGRVRLVGELDSRTLETLERSSPSLAALLHKIRLQGLDREAAQEALEVQRAHDLGNENGPDVLPGALEAIIDVTDRYFPYHPFPGKAVRLHNEVKGARSPAYMSDPKPIKARHIYEHFAALTGIPPFLLREDVPFRKESAHSAFAKRLIGQEEAIAAVVETLCVVKSALAAGDKPLATFLFVGPTGVGKTELAKTLARFLFGSEERLVRFDMSEYTGPGAADRLIGSRNEEGLLTRAVRQRPFSVVLLDEIEKAHPDVFDLLLQVTGEGRLSDAQGRTTYFHNAILILTSNLGAAHRRAPLGIAAATPSDADYYQEQVRQTFRPEMVNRFDRVVPFRALRRDEIRRVTDLVLARISGRRGFRDHGIALKITDAARDLLSERGYSEAYGARALRRHIEDGLVADAAAMLSARDPEQNRNAVLTADVVEDRVQIHYAAGSAESRRDDDAIYNEARAARAEAADFERFPAIETVRSRIAYIVSQLSYGQKKSKRQKKREAREGASHHELGTLAAELHTLKTADDAFRALLEELGVYEELSLLALLQGQEIDEDVGEEIKRLRAAVRSATLNLLLVGTPHHEATVAAFEHKRGRLLRDWLVPLLKEAPRRGWHVLVHEHNDKQPWPSGSDWPTTRCYGPPRDHAKFIERIEDESRDAMGVLVRIRGPHAGIHLAVEDGLLRVDRGPKPELLLIRRVSMRHNIGENEWGKSALVPFGDGVQNLSKRKPSVLVRGGKIVCDFATVELNMEPLADVYWRDHDEMLLRRLMAYERGDHERDLVLDSPLDVADADEGAPLEKK